MARVMIVDDSKFMRKIIRETLEEGGHEIVAEAENGNEALLFYQNEKPDFITMDVTMWDKDGIETLFDIRKKDPDAKIIILSALSEKNLKQSNKNIPADAFITKPFEKKDLLETIKKIL